jgi:hypothetical protein
MSYRELKQKPQKKLCLLCKKPMPAIGDARSNGAGHKEWPTRKYHKKCVSHGLMLERINKQVADENKYDKYID